MAKITELTLKEQAQIPIIRDEWLKIGLSTDPMNRDAARAAICDAYKIANLPEPKIFIYLGSPWAGALGSAFLSKVCNQVRDQVRDRVRAQVGAQVGDQVGAQVGDQVGDQVCKSVYGQHETWLSFYDFFRRTMRGKISGPDRLLPIIAVAQNAGWWWPFANAVIVTDRPASISRDAQNRLHCETGPALAYRDGWSIYAWHGLRIPAHFITEREKITFSQIKSEENVEFRRVLRDLYGRDRYLSDIGARAIDISEYGVLWRGDDGGDEPLVFVEVKNATEEHGERRTFHLRVPPNIKTAHEAVAWGFYKTPETYSPQMEA